jgi:hypothetical protein
MKKRSLQSFAFDVSQKTHDMLFNYMAKSGLILGALQLTVDSLDAIPEPQRALYVEKDGKFQLDVTGIEDTKGLKSALEKERQAAREAEKARKELETKFDGIDPVKVKNLMAKFENQEEATLIAEGKMDKVIEMRTEKARNEAQRLVKEAQTAAEQAEQRAQKFSQRVLDNHIRAAAAKVGLHSHAIEDALYRGRNLFKLDENGDAVQLGADGQPVYGKDGKTPFTPAEWLESMKDIAPHWFPASSGGGAGGGGGKGKPGEKIMTRAEHDERANKGESLQEFFASGGKIVG